MMIMMIIYDDHTLPGAAAPQPFCCSCRSTFFVEIFVWGKAVFLGMFKIQFVSRMQKIIKNILKVLSGDKNRCHHRISV